MRLRVGLLSLLLVGLAACGRVPGGEPTRVRFQQVLVGFEGSVPGKRVQRSAADAERLAAELLARAQKGEDLDLLVRRYSDDPAPAVYSVGNGPLGQLGDLVPRSALVPALAARVFGMKVGETVLIPYGEPGSPYGWHVVRRLE